ncbi:putative transcriptional regulator, Fis family [Taylorella asinigenitalis 14/45]|uniref:Putative Fis-like DNA-binding protein n=1 Tax=Taylorella asinigenitalis 14/45 TaxID=1091495 RepID=I7IBV1_9BURK|nr:helix-turn-helix domain-containing protein [Taylorella asinigenitalis]CCG19440.1 putative transcriptional regulator, Fis family [Taylorella asinigenitalis 14/45]
MTESFNSIQKSLNQNLDRYFAALEGNDPNNVWQMVMSCVEKSLLENIMEKTNGNQSKASQILGINRSTLRKKLLSYNLIQN